MGDSQHALWHKGESIGRYKGSDFLIQEEQAGGEVHYAVLSDLIRLGLSDGEIQERIPHLKGRNLMRGRAFFHTRQARAVSRLRGANRRSLHVFCDENIPITMLRSLQIQGHYATNSLFEDIRGLPDRDVWLYVVERGFDVLLTKDRRNREPTDLCVIARDHWSRTSGNAHMAPRAPLPLVLVVKNDVTLQQQFGELMAAHTHAIINHVQDQTACVVELSASGVVEVPNTLVRTEERLAEQMRRSRAESWARHLVLMHQVRAGIPPAEWRDRTPRVRRQLVHIRRSVGYLSWQSDRDAAAPLIVGTYIALFGGGPQADTLPEQAIPFSKRQPDLSLAFWQSVMKDVSGRYPNWDRYTDWRRGGRYEAHDDRSRRIAQLVP